MAGGNARLPQWPIDLAASCDVAMLTSYEQDAAEIASDRARRKIAISLVCGAVVVAGRASVFASAIINFTARATQ